MLLNSGNVMARDVAEIFIRVFAVDSPAKRLLEDVIFIN